MVVLVLTASAGCAGGGSESLMTLWCTGGALADAFFTSTSASTTPRDRGTELDLSFDISTAVCTAEPRTNRSDTVRFALCKEASSAVPARYVNTDDHKCSLLRAVSAKEDNSPTERYFLLIAVTPSSSCLGEES